MVSPVKKGGHSFYDTVSNNVFCHLAVAFINIVAFYSRNVSAETTRFAETGVYATILGIEGTSSNRFLAQRLDDKVDVISCAKQLCAIEARFDAPGRMWASAETPEGTAVAFGFGRGRVDAPITLIVFDTTFKNQRKIFEVKSERAQVSFLKFENQRLWISFFKSKFEATSGFLQPSPDSLWIFSEVSSGRLEDVVDVLGDSLVVGRPYGDGEGQDGDAKLKSTKDPTVSILLPTYRGVRALRFFDSTATEHPRIIVADGWHQNYGQVAQARLTLLEWKDELKRYGGYLVKRDPEQYGYSRLLALSNNFKSFLAVGNKKIELFVSSPFLTSTTIATATTDKELLDAALIASDSKSFAVAVFNGSIDIIRGSL